MAADPKRQRLMLGGLLAVLGVVAYWQFGGSPAPARGSAPRNAAPAPRTSKAPAQILAEGVGLDRLASARPAPEASGRDPFRTGAADGGPQAGNGASSQAVPVPETPAVPVGPPPPPPVPPIAVKFIGIVARQDVGRVAVLSDGRNVYYGREGEIVDGRWRIVRIGEESIQIEHADGRGRQTLRLTG